MSGLRTAPPVNAKKYIRILSTRRVSLSQNTINMPNKHRIRIRPSKIYKSYRDPLVPAGTHLSHTQRAQIIALSRYAGWSGRRIAKHFSLAESTVRLAIKRGINLDLYSVC
jgi:IS30 family transposase